MLTDPPGVVVGHVDRHPHPVLDLLDHRLGQTGLGDLREDALDAGAPLLHDPGLTEDARQRRVAQPRDPAHGLYGHAGQQKAWAVHLDAVVVEADADGRAALGVGGVDKGVDDDLADRLDGDGVDVAAADLAEDRGLVGVLEEEAHGLVDGQRHGSVDLCLVEDVGAVGSAQASALDPGRGQEAGGVRAGGKDACIRGDDPGPVPHGESEREEVVDVCRPAAQVG